MRLKGATGVPLSTARVTCPQTFPFKLRQGRISVFVEAEAALEDSPSSEPVVGHAPESVTGGR